MQIYWLILDDLWDIDLGVNGFYISAEGKDELNMFEAH